MTLPDLRKYSQAALSLGSAAILVGGALMFTRHVDIGDAIMVTGLVLFIGGALALSRTPTGDKDAG